MKKSIAIIGYGALGRILVDAILDKLSNEYVIKGVWTRNIEKHLPSLKEKGVPAYSTVEELLADSTDYVVEIAGVQVVKDYGQRILESQKHLIVTSVGALSQASFYENLQETARSKGQKVYVTSGAVGGFDIFQAIALMGHAHGQIHTQKAPRSLEGAPHLQGRSLSEESAQLIFDGSAREAIDAFPKNINVAVASALASVGVEDMRTQIESVPGLEANIHEIKVENDSVQALLQVTSLPDPVNPKSSVITAWSVAALLKNLASPIEFY